MFVHCNNGYSITCVFTGEEIIGFPVATEDDEDKLAGGTLIRCIEWLIKVLRWLCTDFQISICLRGISIGATQ